ncbi:MAG: AAA family ATPase [bacterium]|nr:AAA family ATPase [bacterium]
MNKLQIIGHEIQREALLGLCRAQKLSHSLMFVGPAGIGKTLVAKEVSAALVCEKSKEQLGACGKCKNCHLFVSENYPDFYPIDCTNKDVSSVKAIRELISTLQLKSFTGGARIVIFNDAEKLHPAASNALLKTLEEPLKNTYFFIIIENSGKLPLTVASRCHKWCFDSLKKDELLSVANSLCKDVTAEILEKAVTFLDGGVSNLITTIESLDLAITIEKLVSKIILGDLKAAIDLAGMVHSEKELVEVSLSFIRHSVRNEMRIAKHNTEKSQLSKLLLDLIEAERVIFERNLNSFYVLNVVLTQFVANKNGFSGQRSLLSETMI